LVIVGLGIQFLPLPEGTAGTDLVVRTSVLIVSYVLLITFAVVNLRIKGVVLILIGLSMNLAVIASNGGMPVGVQALRDSGQADVLEGLREEGADKHHLMTDEDVLTFLADVIAIPPPVGQAVSVGDLVMYAGLIWAIAAAMRGRTPSTRSSAWEPYRGKHRPGKPRTPEPAPDLGFLPAATRSGTAR
jgi:hypothetical protein